jgi:hypothetical protein
VFKPGEYTVRLTVDGKDYSQSATVKPDPRGINANTANEDVNNHD